MQSALHAATATLPHLRRGLSAGSAAQAVPHLRRLTGATSVALADTRTVLAIDGEGGDQVRPGDMLSRLLARTRDDRVRIEPRLTSSDPSCPLRSAVLAPLLVQGRRAGTLIAFYRQPGRPPASEVRVVMEAASLVSAQLELVGGGRPGGAPGPGRAARTARRDLARTSSTTPWPPSPATSTPAPTTRASC